MWVQSQYYTSCMIKTLKAGNRSAYVTGMMVVALRGCQGAECLGVDRAQCRWEFGETKRSKIGEVNRVNNSQADARSFGSREAK